MEQRLWAYFLQAGYKKLNTDAFGISAFFLKETGFANVVMLYDADMLPDAKKEYYREQAKRITWRFYDSGQSEVHLLSILIAADPARAKSLAEGDGFCWIIDKSDNSLLIPENAAENFYGIRDGIIQTLSDPASASRYPEQPLEYEPGGRRCYRRISQRPIVNHSLMILNLLGYALCILFVSAIYDWGDLRYAKVFENGEWYRIFTSMFMHGDVSHLTGNMIMLLLLGDMAERSLGHIQYFLLYMTGGILAAFTSMYISFLQADPIGSVGASGAIFAVIGAVLWILLRNHGRLETLTTKKLLFLIAYSLYFGFTSRGVDNAAHVGGLIAGFVLAVFLYRKKKLFSPKKREERA